MGVKNIRFVGGLNDPKGFQNLPNKLSTMSPMCLSGLWARAGAGLDPKLTVLNSKAADAKTRIMPVFSK